MPTWRPSHIKGVTSSHKPKVGSMHGGRTWDSIPIFLPTGEKIEGYLDTTWGRYVYFPYGNRWYKVSVDQIEDWKITL